ncbi:hypothetical protein AB0L25_04765 [Spirillospora sp. NPDC052242]
MLGKEWREHHAPTRDNLVKEAAREAADAVAHLAGTVQTARRAGASWTDIGAAVGISRQSAHERWASSDAEQQESQPSESRPQGAEPRTARNG